MADVHSKETRSYNMSQIKGKNTKPEMMVRKFLHANGYRYKLHGKSLPGKPDIVLPKYKTVIFVHGRFGMDIRTANIMLFPKQELEVVLKHTAFETINPQVCHHGNFYNDRPTGYLPYLRSKSRNPS